MSILSIAMHFVYAVAFTSRPVVEHVTDRCRQPTTSSNVLIIRILGIEQMMISNLLNIVNIS